MFKGGKKIISKKETRKTAAKKSVRKNRKKVDKKYVRKTRKTRK